jgi:hypothetical protein
VSALAIAAIAFACVFGGALLGLLLARLLPEAHLGEDSKDIVKLGMGLVATMAALVLSLLIASAKGSYEAQRTGLEQLAANCVLLDRALALYGPEAQQARGLLRAAVASALARIDGDAASPGASLEARATTRLGGDLFKSLQTLAPGNDMQRRLQNEALQIATDLGRTRWLLVEEQVGASVPTPFLVVLVFWLTVLFASFGLFAPRNATVIATLLVCALSVSGAIFLVLEFGQPFEGLLRLSAAPLADALGNLGR